LKKNTHWDELPDILTAQHIANFFAISRNKVYELFRISPEHGGIPCISIGGTKRAEKTDVLAWKENMKASNY
jgi:hypothetical protein